MIVSVAGLHLPHIQPRHPLRQVLAAALPSTPSGDLSPDPYWDAAFFQLDQVTLFQQASPTQQSQILASANHQLLEEAYWVEQAGVGYMAKMVLLADTVEERLLYGQFVADEATHLSQLSQFLPIPQLLQPSNQPNPFLVLLSQIAESNDKPLLLFVIQVILEGWGLSHYRRLARDCREPALAALLTSFLQAESRHHGTGTILFNQTASPMASQTAIVEVLTDFLRMVQVGPQGLVIAIEQVLGDLSRVQRQQILAELQTETHSGSRLALLRSLMHGDRAVPIVEALAARGAFTPLPPECCV